MIILLTKGKRMKNENKWGSHELDLLRSNRADEEVARMLGRSVQAIKSQRSRMADVEKEARLYALAEKLGVRIGG